VTALETILHFPNSVRCHI